jgi:hypothetical protein
MKRNITLSNGRIVTHKPYLIAGKPNGATEAYMLDGGDMTDAEWTEYTKLTAPIPASPKPTWAQIKAMKVAP